MECKFILLAFGLLFLATSSAQLIGPFQACEWKCQASMEKSHDTDSAMSKTEIADACKKYCLKHAYDHLLAKLNYTEPVSEMIGR